MINTLAYSELITTVKSIIVQASGKKKNGSKTFVDKILSD
jgi:hypothetical protein